MRDGFQTWTALCLTQCLGSWPPDSPPDLKGQRTDIDTWKIGRSPAMAQEFWGHSVSFCSPGLQRSWGTEGQEGRTHQRAWVTGVLCPRMLTLLLAHCHITNTEGESVHGWPSHLVKKMHRHDRPGCTGRMCLDAQTIHGQMLLILGTDDRFPGELGHLLSAFRKKSRGKNSGLLVWLSATLTHRWHSDFRAQWTRSPWASKVKESYHPPGCALIYTPISIPSPRSRICPLGLSPEITGLLKSD